MRKAAHEGLNKGVVKRFQPTQFAEGVLLAASMLAQPKNWDAHLRRAAASAIMTMVYDKPPIRSEHDPAVTKVNDFVARLTRAAMPGAHLVEFFPWMRHIPSRFACADMGIWLLLIPNWNRFAPWKKQAEESFETDSAMFKELFNDIHNRKVCVVWVCLWAHWGTVSLTICRTKAMNDRV
jgi:hypothetical protein